MIAFTLRSVAFAALVLPCLGRDEFKSLRRDLPWGHSLNLREFGGPDVEVSVRSRQITFVSVDVADYRRMVPVLVNEHPIYGSGRVVMQPTRESRRVEKKDGVSFPGSRASMFLIHREGREGIAVYFLDESAAQNQDALVIRLPVATKDPLEQPRPGLTAVEELPSAPPRTAAQKDGYLSDRLLEWYLRLQAKREKLDLSDPVVVAHFNEEAARYHAEVKRERALSVRLK